MKQKWQTALLLLLVALILGYLVGRSGTVPSAEAQSAGARAGKIICLIGEGRGNVFPIALVDTLEETLVIYEFNVQTNRLELQAARNFRFDKQIPSYHNAGISIEDVRQRLNP